MPPGVVRGLFLGGMFSLSMLAFGGGRRGLLAGIVVMLLGALALRFWNRRG